MTTPTFVAVASTTYIDLSNTSNLTLDVGSAANRWVAVILRNGIIDASISLSSATYNGESLTVIATYTDSQGYKYLLAHGPVSSTGSNTLTLNISASSSSWWCTAIAYSGVDQTTPISATPINNSAGSGSGVSFSVGSVAADEIVVAGFSSYQGYTFTEGSPATQRQFATPGGTYKIGWMDEVGTGTVVIDGTLSGSGSDWGGRAFRLKAAAAGGSAVPILMHHRRLMEA